MRSRILAILLTALAVWTASAEAGIVHNNVLGALYEDWVTIPFQILDESGKPLVAASGDKLSVIFWYPDGDSAFAESNVSITTSPRITDETPSMGGGTIGLYTYTAKVAEIDGTGENGTYKYTMVVLDSSSALNSTYSGEFQLYENNWFSVLMDSLRLSDVRRINGDAVAAANLASAFDATVDSSVVLDLKQLRLVGSKNDAVTTAPLHVRNWGDGYSVNLQSDTAAAVLSIKANVNSTSTTFLSDDVSTALRLKGFGAPAIGCFSSGTANSSYAAYVLCSSSTGSEAVFMSSQSAGGVALRLESLSGSDPACFIGGDGTDAPALALRQKGSSSNGAAALSIATHAESDSAAVRIIAPSGKPVVKIYGAPHVDSSWITESARRAIGREAWETDTNSSATGGWVKTSGGGSEQFGDWNGQAAVEICMLRDDTKTHSFMVTDTTGGRFASVRGAEIIITDRVRGEEVARLQTNDAGLIELPLSCTGAYNIRVSKPGYHFSDGLLVPGGRSTTLFLTRGYRVSADHLEPAPWIDSDGKSYVPSIGMLPDTR